MVRRELARPLVLGVTELPYSPLAARFDYVVRGPKQEGRKRHTEEPSIPVLKGAQAEVRTCAENPASRVSPS